MLPVPPNKSQVFIPSISRILIRILNRPSFASSVVGRAGILAGGLKCLLPNVPPTIRMRVIVVIKNRHKTRHLLYSNFHSLLQILSEGNIVSGLAKSYSILYA